MNDRTLSRREFLKLTSLLPLGAAGLKFGTPLAGQPNILVIVFDAWSGRHLPCYGYPRQTTPNLDKLLAKAIVYHNHYSAGSSTTPGTASLLTGTYPWTHRAFSHDAPAREVLHHNLFNAFGNLAGASAPYYRMMYTHNAVADTILKAMQNDVDLYIPRQQLYLTKDWLDVLFSNDYDIASLSVNTVFESKLNINSLFLNELYQKLINARREGKRLELLEPFPNSPPNIQDNNYYLLEDGIDWLIENLPATPQPYLGYFHFLPPHAPYQTNRKEFIGALRDQPDTQPPKPQHLFSQGMNPVQMNRDRGDYDEYILYVDAEFGRLFEALQTSGALDNTWLVLTSDHGEMFERGIIGHTTPALFDPLLRVPLAIFGPGIQKRQNIHTLTSSLDILPTLLTLAGQPVPDWCEGEILPPFREEALPPNRAVYAVTARNNEKFKPLTNASISMRQGNYRLSAYFGYEESNGETVYEMYHLKENPEEQVNMYERRPKIAAQMTAELEAKLDEVNQPYR